jgi:hypothetical protein
MKKTIQYLPESTFTNVYRERGEREHVYMFCYLSYYTHHVFEYTHTPLYVLDRWLINIRGTRVSVMRRQYVYRSAVHKLILVYIGIYMAVQICPLLLLKMYSTHSYAHEAPLLL